MSRALRETTVNRGSRGHRVSKVLKAIEEREEQVDGKAILVHRGFLGQFQLQFQYLVVAAIGCLIR